MLKWKDVRSEIWVLMQQLEENALNIYTDGSCRPSPRRGGVGFLFITVDENGNEQVLEQCPPGWRSATNNQMELQACIDALAFVLDRHSPFNPSHFNKIVIHTDSMYVAGNFNKAKFEWPKTKWRTREGPPVANTEQWKELISLVKKAGVRVEIKWVKAHKDDPHNIKVDELAKKSADDSSKRTLKPQRVRRKRSPLKVERGSVEMTGQVTVIHITADEWLRPPHNCYKFTYEVIDPTSSYHLARDICHSRILLSAGHFYRVRFNDNTRDPWIEEKIEEISREDIDEETP
jgi:ribonuclease HI